jgi:16S rRNA (uracil1498-N3)-methyltransferase
LARRRFFVDAVRGGMAELRGEEARHLTRVLRAEAGQRYEISDGNVAYLAEIAEARGLRVVFRVIEPLATPATPLHITLCAALIKFDRFEWIVEKATELGVERILPVEAERSGKGLLEASRKRTERWARIARESSQQSRRVRAPEIPPAVRFERSLAEEADYRYFLEEGDAPPPCSPAPRAAGPMPSGSLPPPLAGSRSRSVRKCCGRKRPPRPPSRCSSTPGSRKPLQ